MAGRSKKESNIYFKLTVNNELKKILEIYLSKKGTTIEEQLEKEIQSALDKTITKFVPKDVQNLLKEMELIEHKQKKKEEKENEKEYVEDDIKNDEINEENINEIEEKESYFNEHNEEKRVQGRRCF